MTVPITLSDLANLQNETTAVTLINNNSTAIENAFALALDVSGDQMIGNLDMNNAQILNLPAPATMDSPVRLQDVASNPTITVPPIGTSGGTVPLLNGTNTWSNPQSFTSTTNSGTLAVTGNTTLGGTAAITGNTTVGGTLGVTGATTLAAVTTTGITDSGNLSVTGTTTHTGAVTVSGGIVGITNGSNATAGNIGEYVESVLPSAGAVSLSVSVPKNVTSITLTPGDWDVTGMVAWAPASTTTWNQLACCVSTTANTLDQTNGRFSQLTTSLQSPSGAISALSIMPCRFNVTTNTTINLVGFANFATSSMSAYGTIRARRMR